MAEVAEERRMYFRQIHKFFVKSGSTASNSTMKVLSVEYHLHSADEGSNPMEDPNKSCFVFTLLSKGVASTNYSSGNLPIRDLAEVVLFSKELHNFETFHPNMEFKKKIYDSKCRVSWSKPRTESGKYFHRRLIIQYNSAMERPWTIIAINGYAPHKEGEFREVETEELSERKEISISISTSEWISLIDKLDKLSQAYYTTHLKWMVSTVEMLEETERQKREKIQTEE